MKRLFFVLFFVLCLCSFAPVALMEGNYWGYFGGPWTGNGTWITTSSYGPRDMYGRDYHYGADIAGTGDQGFAASCGDGIVDWIGFDTQVGYIVIIKHDNVPFKEFPNGIYTRYIDLSAILPEIQPGQRVSKGQPIGEIDDISHYAESTGSHVHVEFRPDYGGDCDNDPCVDPALFVPEIEAGSGSASLPNAPYSVHHGGPFGQFQKVFFEFKYEMLKGFRDLFETISKTIVEGMRRIHGIIRGLFITLIMIDLALGTMFKMFSDDDGGSMVRFLLHKFLFYGMMLLLIENFSDLANHFVKDLFISSAGRALSVQEAEVVKIISDPMLIIEKGMNIIQPFINRGLDFSWDILGSVAKTLLPSFLADKIDSQSFFEMIMTAILCTTFVIMLLFIGFMIALAYMQFYFMILFSFTTMIFAGTKQTRQTRLANKGLSGVFAGALNLMFYCLFSLMLTTSMVAIAEQAKAVTAVTTYTQSPKGNYEANARTVYEDFKAAGYSDEAIAGILGRLQQENNFDPSAGHEHVWIDEDGEEWIVGGYGMYQWNGDRTEEYLKWASSHGYNPEDPHAQNIYAIQEAYGRRCSPEDMNGMSAAQAAEHWTDKWEVGEHGNEIYYAQEWREQIAEWNADGKPQPQPKGEPQKGAPRTYTRKIAGTGSLMVLVQLNLCLFVFLFLGTRISKSINSLFQGDGFELLNSKNDG